MDVRPITVEIKRRFQIPQAYCGTSVASNYKQLCSKTRELKTILSTSSKCYNTWFQEFSLRPFQLRKSWVQPCSQECQVYIF